MSHFGGLSVVSVTSLMQSVETARVHVNLVQDESGGEVDSQDSRLPPPSSSSAEGSDDVAVSTSDFALEVLALLGIESLDELREIDPEGDVLLELLFERIFAGKRQINIYDIVDAERSLAGDQSMEAEIKRAVIDIVESYLNEGGQRVLDASVLLADGPRKEQAVAMFEEIKLTLMGMAVRTAPEHDENNAGLLLNLIELGLGSGALYGEFGVEGPDLMHDFDSLAGEDGVLTAEELLIIARDPNALPAERAMAQKILDLSYQKDALTGEYMRDEQGRFVSLEGGGLMDQLDTVPEDGLQGFTREGLQAILVSHFDVRSGEAISMEKLEGWLFEADSVLNAPLESWSVEQTGDEFEIMLDEGYTIVVSAHGSFELVKDGESFVIGQEGGLSLHADTVFVLEDGTEITVEIDDNGHIERVTAIKYDADGTALRAQVTEYAGIDRPFVHDPVFANEAEAVAADLKDRVDEETVEVLRQNGSVDSWQPDEEQATNSINSVRLILISAGYTENDLNDLQRLIELIGGEDGQVGRTDLEALLNAHEAGEDRVLIDGQVIQIESWMVNTAEKLLSNEAVFDAIDKIQNEDTPGVITVRDMDLALKYYTADLFIINAIEKLKELGITKEDLLYLREKLFFTRKQSDGDEYVDSSKERTWAEHGTDGSGRKNRTDHAIAGLDNTVSFDDVLMILGYPAGSSGVIQTNGDPGRFAVWLEVPGHESGTNNAIGNDNNPKFQNTDKLANILFKLAADDGEGFSLIESVRSGGEGDGELELEDLELLIDLLS